MRDQRREADISQITCISSVRSSQGRLCIVMFLRRVTYLVQKRVDDSIDRIQNK